MNLKKRFLDECGVDLTDYEYAGKFPSRNKYGRWGNIPRGEGWKRYAEWLEKLVTDSLPIYSKFSFVNVYEDQECRFISDEEYETYESAFNNRDDLSTYKETVQIVRKTKK